MNLYQDEDLLNSLKQDNVLLFRSWLEEAWPKKLEDRLEYNAMCEYFAFGNIYKNDDNGLRSVGLMNLIYEKRSYECFADFISFLESLKSNIINVFRWQSIYLKNKEYGQLGKTFWQLITATNEFKDMQPWMSNTREFWIKFFEDASFKASAYGLMKINDKVAYGIIESIKELYGEKTEVLIALHAAKIIDKSQVEWLIEEIKKGLFRRMTLGPLKTLLNG